MACLAPPREKHLARNVLVIKAHADIERADRKCFAQASVIHASPRSFSGIVLQGEQAAAALRGKPASQPRSGSKFLRIRLGQRARQP